MKAIFFVVLFSGGAFAQTASSVESADVQGSAPVANPSVQGSALRGGRFELNLNGSAIMGRVAAEEFTDPDRLFHQHRCCCDL
jgi:hypothetical protein